MTDMSMVEQPMEDDEFDGMMDPVEQKQLELLAVIAQQMQQAVMGLQLAVQQLQQIAQISAMERETTAVGRDGREMKATSRIKG